MLAVCPKTRLWAQKRRINKYLITLCLPGIQNEIKGHKYSHFVTGRKVLSAEVPSSPSIPQTASCQLQREKLTVPSANLFEFCGSPFSRKPFSRPQSIVKLPDSGIRSYTTHSHYNAIGIPDNIDLFSLLNERLESFKDRPLIIEGLTGKTTTHSQFYEQASAVGSALTKHGLTSGDVVCICAQNCLEFVVTIIGCAGIGAATAPVNSANTAPELIAQLKLASAKFLVVTPDVLEIAQAAVGGDKELQSVKIIVIGLTETATTRSMGIVPFNQLLQDSGDAFPPASERLRIISDPTSHTAILPFSSGTTGLPKAVELTHFSLISNILQLTNHAELCGPTTDGSRDRSLALLPMFHMGGIFSAMIALRVGNTMVTLSGFQPISFLETISNYKVGCLMLVPPLVLFLNKHPLVKDYDLSCVRDIVCGAAPLCNHLQKDVATQLGLSGFRQTWGMTELSPIATMGRTTELIPGSSGVLIPNTSIKVVPSHSLEKEGDAEEEELKEGDTGELVVKGPQMMKGYLKNPKATEAMITPDGWLRTGDIGYIKDGQTFVVDRLKELIKYKGHQVAPAELESLLLLHPSVADAAVIGVKHDVGGEVPRAFVVFKPGVDADAKAISRLQCFVDELVNPHSRLRGGLGVVDSIPKSGSGKILRRVLRDQLRPTGG